MRASTNSPIIQVRKLVIAVREFYATDSSWPFYGGTLLVLAAAVFINYSPLIDIQWATRNDSNWVWLGHYVLLYGGLYYASALLGGMGSGRDYLRNPWFWLLSAAFILIAILPKLGVLPIVSGREHPDWSGAERYFVSKSHFFIHQFLLTGTLLLVLRWAVRRWVPLDFGLHWDWPSVRPYLILLLLVSPLMVAASFLPDFQQAYPQYRPWFREEVAFGLPAALRVFVFTTCYSTGFIAVELLFRGAMCIGLFRIMGTRAVLPMAAIYCAFHFGKPMGEAIASIFGSYLLGVLAIHGRSIAGGVVVHLGVALLMELMGHVQHQFS